jgi:hypothetical protein
VLSQAPNNLGKFILDRNNKNELYSILYPLFKNRGDELDHLLIVTSQRDLGTAIADEMAKIDSRDIEVLRPKK